MSTDPRTISDPTLKALALRIVEQADGRLTQLAGGDAEDFPAYKQAVGYLAGLQDVLEMIQQMESERTGARPDGETA